jgi:hypothetical protein
MAVAAEEATRRFHGFSFVCQELSAAGPVSSAR